MKDKTMKMKIWRKNSHRAKWVFFFNLFKSNVNFISQSFIPNISL